MLHGFFVQHYLEMTILPSIKLLILRCVCPDGRYNEVFFFFLLNQPKPRIDYVLKAVGGSLTAFPGLSDMIDVSVDIFSSSTLLILDIFCLTDNAVVYLWKDTVNTIVTDMLEWPHRIVVPIGGVPVDNRYLQFYKYFSH